MSPFVDNGQYGYADKKTGKARYRVTYFGPRIRVPVSPSRRPPFTDRAKQQAEELALWRGAQLAEANGRGLFSVLKKESDVEVDVTRDRYFYPHYRFPLGHRGRYWGYPYHDPWGYYPFPRASARAQIVLIIELHDRPRPGAFNASQVIREFRYKYGPVTTEPAARAKPG